MRMSKQVKASEPPVVRPAAADRELKRRQLSKLDLLEREAWDGWERSKQTGHAGDPRMLLMVLRCVERRCQILGLDAAKPDGAKPDGAKPDGAKPDAAKPDAG